MESITAREIQDGDKKLLSDIQDALANCMKCGNCMAVCPIYKETGKEASVARGKLALMEGVLSGKLEISAAFDSTLAKCLCCKACTAKCPCGVKADELIIRGRQAAVRARGLHPIKKGVFRFLANRTVFDLALRLAGIFGPLSFKRLPGKMAAIARFPMPGMDRKRVTAPFAATPLRNRYPEVIKVPAAKLKVGFFTGCTINYIYTDVGDAVINVLRQNGVEIVLPKAQHCCGTPVYVSGDKELAKDFARHIIQVFSEYEVDYVVAACGSCAEALKIEYPHMFQDDPEMKGLAQKLAKKTYEISEFLVDVMPFDKDHLGVVSETVTMHDPCHMARGIKVTQQPREILKAIPGVKFVEMKDADRCCGSGGSFSLANYQLSRQINDKKVENIKATAANVVATSCGTCRMHLTDGLVQNRVPADVVHVIQLLDKSYRAKRGDGSLASEERLK
jgi:glycolate oxidase iron-sulfur subunit